MIHVRILNAPVLGLFFDFMLFSIFLSLVYIRIYSHILFHVHSVDEGGFFSAPRGFRFIAAESE